MTIAEHPLVAFLAIRDANRARAFYTLSIQQDAKREDA
jgi:hypothetical protein